MFERILRRVLAAGLLTIATAAPLLTSHAEDKPAAAKPGASPSDAILGEWWTEGNEGRIRFSREKDGTFRGTTTCCVPNPPTKDKPGKDINNPNPKQRDRSTVGIILIWKLTYDEDGEYTDGYVYNPRDGKTYRMQIKVLDAETLKIRGYMGLPVLGQSQVWKRAHLQPGAAAATTTAKP